MTPLQSRFLVLVAAAATWGASPVAVLAGQPAVTVSGGGTAEFLDDDGNKTGDTSQFSVGAVIGDDDTVKGHFTCMIVAVVTISGDVEDFELHYGDDGELESVTLFGTAHGVDHLFDDKVFTDCDFEVTLFPGGADVGGFIYSDCVVTDDEEVVTKGQISFQEH